MRRTATSVLALVAACWVVGGAAGAVRTTAATNGTLEVCKSGANGAAGTTFTFSVQKGTAAPTSVNVAGGSCSKPLSETPGTYKVTEDLSSGGWTMVSGSVIPDSAFLASTPRAALMKATVTAGQDTQVTFVNQQAAGVLKVCKWSSSPALQGTQVTFAVGTQVVSATTGKSAASAGCSTALPTQPGTRVTISEAVPNNVVAKLASTTGATVTSSSGGVVKITTGAGVNAVTFEDEPVGPPQTGFLEICKDAGDEFVSSTDAFTFTVTDKDNASSTVDVVAGQCSGPLKLPAGTVSVAEKPSRNTVVSGFSTFPNAGALGVTNLVNGTANVIVPVSSSSSGEVQLHVVNSTPTAPLKVCKLLTAGSDALAGQTFTFTVNGSAGQVFRVPVIAAAGDSGACKIVTYASAQFPIGSRSPFASAQFPIGSSVSVTESLAKFPNVSGDGNGPGNDDTRQVTIVSGSNTIIFHNQALGQLEICKNMQRSPSDDTAYNGAAFQFSVDGSDNTVSVAAGQCSLPIVVPVGTHTVQEVNIPAAFQFVSSTAQGPLTDNRATSGTAANGGNPITILVPYMDAPLGGGETLVTFVNKVKRASFKVCKTVEQGSSAALGGLTFTFDYQWTGGTPGKVDVPAGTCSGLFGGADGIPVVQPDGTPTTVSVTEEINGPFKVTGISVDNGANINADLVNHTVTFQAQAGVAAVQFTNAYARAALAISKDDGAETAVPGTFVTWTITVTNNGPDYAYNLEVDDTLPAQGCNNDSSPNLPANVTFDDTNAPSVVSWFDPKLGPGKTLTLKLKCKIPAGATGSYVNTATASASDASSVLDADTDALTPQANLAVAKTLNNGPPVPGTTLTYTIKVTNNGPSNVTGFHLTDNPVGPGLTPIASPWQNKAAFTPSSQTEGDWAGTLSPGDSFTITWKGKLDPGATGTVENDATANPTLPSGITDPDPSDNTAKNVENVAPTADLAVVKTLNNGPPVPGTTLTYTIKVTNNGPSNVTGFHLTDNPVGPGLTPNASPWQNKAAFTPSSTTAGDWAGTLGPGDSFSITWKGKLAANATGTVENDATVSPTAPAGITDPDTSNNTSQETETVSPQVDLTVTKTSKPASAVPGNNETYTITLTNGGPSTVTSVHVKDTITPANACTSLTPTASAGTFTSTTGEGDWTGLNLNSGDPPVTLTLVCAIDPTLAGTANDGKLANSVTIEPNGAAEQNDTDNTASVSNTITPKVDLTVKKTSKPANAVPGNNETYTIKVTNGGPSSIDSVHVVDTTTPANACTSLTPTSTTAGTFTSTTGTGDWTGLGLASGSSATLVLTCAVDPTLAGTANGGNLQNSVNVEPNGATETKDGDNTDSVSNPIVPTVDLTVKKTSSPKNAVPGNNETYTIKVTNNGPSTITSVHVIDTITPANACTSLTPSTSSGTFTSTTGTGDWTGLTLASGSSATLTLTCAIDPTLAATANGGSLTNQANVEPNGATESKDSDNTDSVSNTIVPTASVKVTKTDSKTTIRTNRADTYTITVKNNGPSTITSFTLTDSPTDFTPNSSPWTLTSVGGNLSGATTTSVTWTGSLPSGSSVTITYAGTSGTTTGTGAMVNTVTASPPSGITFTGTTSDTDTDDVTA